MEKESKLNIILVLIVAVFLMQLFLKPIVEIKDRDWDIKSELEDLKNNCQNANNNYVMFQFKNDKPIAQHKLIKIEFDENYNLQNIFEWNETDNSFKTIYFRGYE